MYRMSVGRCTPSSSPSVSARQIPNRSLKALCQNVACCGLQVSECRHSDFRALFGGLLGTALQPNSDSGVVALVVSQPAVVSLRVWADSLADASSPAAKVV